MTRRPHLAALGDPLADIVIAVRPGTCERWGVAPGTAVFRDRAELDEAMAALGGGRVSAGGSAANTCVAFAGCGGRAALVTTSMADDLAEAISRDLLDRGVELPLGRQPTGMAGRCLAFLLPDGERAFLIWQGEPWRLRTLRADAERYFAGRPDCDGVLIEGYLLASEDGMEVARLASRRAAGLGIRRIMALSDKTVVAANRHRFKAILADGVDVVLGNENEYKALSESGSMDAEATGLSRRDVLAVVTMGNRGAVLYAPDSRHVVTADQLPVRSSIGAGDAFAGGFLYGLLSGLPHAESLSIGNAQANRVLRVGQSRVPL
ncbi:hypothetical protein ALI144C_31860 [Actinosynnema sp. ALI-1.44]|uniref:carbohydrate kinase family protein n=1 Tax=Actinosynnema sp. ALI-1.44 TaxID=1933779 RepID=UPI00097C4D88|nr:PfkB family carbohydrate kinase [Actinosynnema sp. ALI-1.44]ONI77991.1 hypothetical protein ALI144C_31860 [Actinosynnema sp. ALI-1.44]